MSQIIKVFTGIFMAMFLITSSAGVLGAFCQILRAQNTHAAIIDEIENSHYAKNVMEACFETAKNENYYLQMTFYSDNQKIATSTCREEVPDETKRIQMAEVVLTFPIELAFFQVNVTQQLFGYAR